MIRNIMGIRVEDDIEWNNINYTALGTIITTMIVFLVTLYMMVI